jgi:hypothetical protein
MKFKNNKGNNNSTKTGGSDKFFYISRFDDPHSDIVATIRKVTSENSCNIFNFIQ